MSLSVNEITNTVPAIDMDITEQVDPSKYNSWHQLLRVSANVLKAMIKFKGQKPPSQVDLINIVKHSWLVSMMSETRKMLKNTKLSGFIIYEKDGIIYATTRSKQKNLNPEDLVILSHKHPVTKMILSDFHVSHGHGGVQQTVARSRVFFWIPQASKLQGGEVHQDEVLHLQEP